MSSSFWSVPSRSPQLLPKLLRLALLVTAAMLAMCDYISAFRPVDHVEFKHEPASKPDDPDPLQNKMAMLWGAPVLKRTLLTPAQAADPEGPNAKLRDTILKGYHSFKKEDSQWDGTKSGISRTGLNERFYDMQVDTFEEKQELWEPLQGSDQVYSLVASLRYLIKMYLFHAHGSAWDRPADAPQSIDEMPDPIEHMFMFAVVHEGCMGTVPHVYPEASVTGVYYVDVPEGSGALVLSDPRGIREPFDRELTHFPKAGEVVIFPPWLQQRTEPSCGVTEDNPRVALAFNILGQYDMMSGSASLVFDLVASSDGALTGDEPAGEDDVEGEEEEEERVRGKHKKKKQKQKKETKKTKTSAKKNKKSANNKDAKEATEQKKKKMKKKAAKKGKGDGIDVIEL